MSEASMEHQRQEATAAARRHLLSWGLGLMAAGAVALVPGKAQACDASNPEQYRSELTVWCVDPTVWAEHQADIEAFFPYGDQVITKLGEVFNVMPDDLPYSIVARAPDGGAQTPTRYGPGVEVTGDAFWNSMGGVDGFWGYLLVLHEFVNQWTGLVTGGWPTDWWADHRSPFPNAMDELIIRELGHPDAADVQHGRMLDDPQVQLFLDIYGLPGYGFDGYSRAFTYIQQNDLSWFALSDPPDYTDSTVFVSGNPSVLLSEYVIAFLSLGDGEDLTSMFTAAGVGTLQPDSWSDPPWQDYEPSAQAVGDIADAHCSIAAAAAAGVDVSDARGALRRGDYLSATAVGYDCATHCPTECACDSVSGACVAPWRGDSPPAPGEGGSSGGGGSPAVGGGAGSPASGGDPAGGGSGGATTSGGATASGASSGSGGSPATGGAASPGDGGVGEAAAPADGSSDEGGCSCRTAGGGRGSASFLLGLLSALALARGRRRNARG